MKSSAPLFITLLLRWHCYRYTHFGYFAICNSIIT